MFAAVNVDTAESDRAGETTVGDGNDEHRRWKRRCPGRSRLEKRFGTTDRTERRAYAGGTDPECTAEWPGGARGRAAGAGPAMGRSTECLEAQAPVPPDRLARLST